MFQETSYGAVATEKPCSFKLQTPRLYLSRPELETAKVRLRVATFQALIFREA